MKSELFRYLFVGVGSNVVNFLVYLTCYGLGISLFLSSATGYSAGLVISYHFGRVWVFDHKFDVDKKNITKFLLVYAVGGLGMGVIIEYLDQSTGLDYRISWFLGAGFAVINNFLGLKWLVFKMGNK